MDQNQVEQAQAQFQKERQALWDKTFHTNVSLQKRVYRLGIECDYSYESDILVVNPTCQLRLAPTKNENGRFMKSF